MDLWAERIPKVGWNKLYSINLDKVKKMTGTEVLTVFGETRGYFIIIYNLEF